MSILPQTGSAISAATALAGSRPGFRMEGLNQIGAANAPGRKAAMAIPETTLTEAEFIERFVAEMLRIVGPKDCDGESVELYARETAPSYFEEQFRLDDMSPEECARTDVSYWEA